MDRENSISLSGITNLLQHGALLGHKGEWILIEGPFTPSKSLNSGEISIFCPDFYNLGAANLYRGQKEYRLSSDELRSICESFLSSQKPLSTPLLGKADWQEPEFEHFRIAFNLIQERIAKKEIQKAVPVVFAQSSQTVNDVEKAQMILNMLSIPETLYGYGFWQDGEGFLGATPEVLFEYSKNRLKTMALAGTCPKTEKSSRCSLLEDAKELQEHLLVVEDIEQVLAPWGEVRTQGPDVVELPSLYHLKTDFEVSCRQQPDFMTLIQKLHPTPALGVAPRSAGYQWMKAFPGQEPRKAFGAPVGFLEKEEALCLVAIRNLQWNKNLTRIGSGCGIVAASEVEREWRELFQKRLSVKKVLGLTL